MLVYHPETGVSFTVFIQVFLQPVYPCDTYLLVLLRLFRQKKQSFVLSRIGAGCAGFYCIYLAVHVNVFPCIYSVTGNGRVSIMVNKKAGLQNRPAFL
jgi:hypothetical protein